MVESDSEVEAIVKKTKKQQQLSPKKNVTFSNKQKLSHSKGIF